jgi:hypothetical protein
MKFSAVLSVFCLSTTVQYVDVFTKHYKSVFKFVYTIPLKIVFPPAPRSLHCMATL